MATFAPPVQRDRFIYSSVLYADAGDGNRHPRASVAELTALLRPEAPKNKKAKTPAASAPTTDPPWHFWTAQLIHYGLTSTKDKNAAKIRLLGALNENRLVVPSWVTKLEAEVKKEWEAENKKLSKTAKEAATPRSSAKKKTTVTASKSSPLNISVNIELSHGTLATGSATGSATAPTTPKSTTTKRKRDPSELSRTATPTKKSKPRVKKEDAVKTELNAYDGHLPVPTARPGPSDIVLSGAYDIGIDWIMYPIFDTYADGPFQFDVFMDGTTGICWAKFHWAMLDGIIKMDPGPTYDTATHFHTLGWRIRNEETGKLTFGRNCTGKIRFHEATGTLEGYLYDVPGAGRIDFQGNRIPGPRRVGNLSREWDHFVEEAYGATRY